MCISSLSWEPLSHWPRCVCDVLRRCVIVNPLCHFCPLFSHTASRDVWLSACASCPRGFRRGDHRHQPYVRYKLLQMADAPSARCSSLHGCHMRLLGLLRNWMVMNTYPLTHHCSGTPAKRPPASSGVNQQSKGSYLPSPHPWAICTPLIINMTALTSQCLRISMIRIPCHSFRHSRGCPNS